jgi:hypothetical protein
MREERSGMLKLDDDAKLGVDWWGRQEKARAKIRQLFRVEDNGFDLTGYDLGTVRTIEDYEVYAGVNFKTKSVQKHTINNGYLELDNQTHDIYRNYKQIITRENYIKPEITDCVYLNTGHYVAILKTFWLRLIQRKWKNIIKERENIVKKRCTLNSLRHRELTGKWPNDCLHFPQLKGMLSQLKT